MVSNTSVEESSQEARTKVGEGALNDSANADPSSLTRSPCCSSDDFMSYIVPTHLVDNWLKDDFHTWATTPGAKGQQRDATTKRRLFYLDDDTTKLAHGYQQKLAPHNGAWETLAKRQHAIEQLASLAQQAGLDIVELASSGMNGKQLLDYVTGMHERVNAANK